MAQRRSVGLRWHAQVRTLNGAVTSGVRVRATTAHDAVDRAQRAAFKRWRDELPQYALSDWFVIYVGLHEADDNNIGKVR